MSATKRKRIDQFDFMKRMGSYRKNEIAQRGACAVVICLLCGVFQDVDSTPFEEVKA